MNIDTSRIGAAYQNSAVVQAMVDYAASLARNNGTITLDRATSVLPFGRREVTKAMRIIARAGVAKFVVGRRGNASRMQWTVPPKEVHKAVTTVPPARTSTVPPMPEIPKLTAAEALHMADMFMQLSDYLEKVAPGAGTGPADASKAQ